MDIFADYGRRTLVSWEKCKWPWMLRRSKSGSDRRKLMIWEMKLLVGLTC